MSDRVDALKQKTGVDIARQAPPGSDWEDEDEMGSRRRPVPTVRGADTDTGTASIGEDGKSFSGRDLRKDFQRAFGRSGSGYSAGSGSYGFGGGGDIMDDDLGESSGAYGFSGGSMANPFSRGAAPNMMAGGNASGMGLSQQVSALETEIFRKTYSRDPLTTRLNRQICGFPSGKTIDGQSVAR